MDVWTRKAYLTKPEKRYIEPLKETRQTFNMTPPRG